MPNIKNNNSEDKQSLESVENNSSNDSKEEISSLKKQLELLTSLVNSLSKNNSENNSVSEDISITSLFNGSLNLISSDGGKITFDKFGDTRVVPKSVIFNYLTNNMPFFQKGYFYVHSEDIVAKYGMSNFYKTLLTNTVISNIINYSTDDITSLITNAPQSQKDILREMLVDKYVNNEIADITKLRLIDKCCGINETSDQSIISEGEIRKKQLNNGTEGKDN